MHISIGLLLLVAGMAPTMPMIQAKGNHKVHCTENQMTVDVMLPDVQPIETPTQVYLEGMKGYPNPKCEPYVTGNMAQFKLPLQDFFECGVTRVINQLTGKKVYYHKIIVETNENKEFVSVKCVTMALPTYNVTRHSHSIARRDVLPPGFEEPIDLEITTSLTGNAPDPILGVGVRQNGEIVNGELNVSPGTPLAMEIYLDPTSAPVYGLAVTYMQVTDTKSQEETIIFNGCSVDAYLFDNFNTVDGDFLSAKFRAFKFPESTYVQFRGTVNVCLDKCKGVQCSNGQIGYGRRRRRSVDSSPDPNKVYEISMTTFIKVTNDEADNEHVLSKLEQKLNQLKLANQKLERNSRDSTSDDQRSGRADNVASGAVDAATVDMAMVEETTLTRLQQHGGAFAMMAPPSAAIPLCLDTVTSVVAAVAIVFTAMKQIF